LDNIETQATLGTRYRTKTNKIIIETHQTEKISTKNGINPCSREW